MPTTLDIKSYVGKACTLLTADQRTALNAPPPEPNRGVYTCELERSDPRWRLVILLSPEADVLGRAYAESNLDLWQQFQPISVGGQPAVLHSFGPPGKNLMCEVVVGTGPNQGTTINTSGSDQTVDRCAIATKAAEFVIGNLRG